MDQSKFKKDCRAVKHTTQHLDWIKNKMIVARRSAPRDTWTNYENNVKRRATKRTTAYVIQTEFKAKRSATGRATPHIN